MYPEEHEAWNATHYPGTRQLCEECGEPTGRCEEDSIYKGDAGPLCESCRDKHDEDQAMSNESEAGEGAQRPSTATCYGEWRPFNSAPRGRHATGARVIMFAPSQFPDEEGIVGEAFLGEDGFWYWAGLEVGYHDTIDESNAPPTHWMPLPDAP